MNALDLNLAQCYGFSGTSEGAVKGREARGHAHEHPDVQKMLQSAPSASIVAKESKFSPGQKLDRYTARGNDGEVEVHRGAGDGQWRLKDSSGSSEVHAGPIYAFHEALKQTDRKYSQKEFHKQVAIAQEGEQDSE